MQRILLVAVILGLTLGSTASTRAEDDPHDFVARGIEALGGGAQLRQARATEQKIKGVFHDLDGVTFSGTVIMQWHDQAKLSLVLDVNGTKVTIAQVLNRDKGWSRTDEELTEEAEGATLRDMQRSAYVDHLVTLVPLLDRERYQLTSLGETRIQDRPAVGILVKSPGQPDVKLYLDKATYLPVKVAHMRPDPMTRQDILSEEYFSDYRAMSFGVADEQTLKAAGKGSDPAALLDILGKGTLDDARREKLRTLIRQLGDPNFQVREKANEELLAQGEVAAPLLSLATQSSDPEVANRARTCLQQIGKTPDAALMEATVRLLAQRKPEGAAAVLLAYLPSAPTQAVKREVELALASVAQVSGQPNKVLVQALADPNPQRRAAAAVALGRDKSASQGPPIQRLYLPGVKRACKGVQFRDDKKALPLPRLGASLAALLASPLGQGPLVSTAALYPARARTLEWKLLDIQFFTRLGDQVFDKP